MADPEHLEILRQGVEVWNEWRGKHVDVLPDLSDAQLIAANLSGAHLSGAHLSGANFIHVLLKHADLSRVDFSRANLKYADLSCANLKGANLYRADFSGANLSDADLSRANLGYADFSHANFIGASLSGASLSGASLSGADLGRADLSRVYFSDADFTDVSSGETTFTNNDLRKVKGLETVKHRAPSSIGTDTLYQSAGNIPEVFLRGCGLSDWQIENAKLYQPELSNEEITNILYRVHDLRAHQAIQISPLFISYSRADSPFVDKVETQLNKRGVRFWRDVHHSTAGRLERQIDRAIRLNPTVVLILSGQSVISDWVEHEARLARKLEQETGRDVLCPVALDDSWETCRWPERLREQIMEYNILDFSEWRDEDKFRHMFTRLLDGLDLFYK